VLIRPAHKTHAYAIAKLHTTSWQTNYTYALSKHYLQHQAAAERQALWLERMTKPRPNQQVFIAEEHSELVGFACIFLDESKEFGSCLDNLHVAAAHQGKGIGKALVQAVANSCVHAAQSESLCLLVNQNNARAQNFYLKLGGVNERADTWAAPDGSKVPTFWFVWRQLQALIAG
jgi:ribosomal protein S18 acetylase RimI-like enzyme